MLDKSIKYIEKQREMYIIQEQSITTHARKKDIENKVKAQLRKQIQIFDYILEILNKQKK